MEKQITHNQIAVMLEELRSKFDILIEGQMSLDQRLRIIEDKVDKLQETVDQHTREIEVMKVILKQQSIEIEKIKSRLDSMDARLENIENRENYERRVTTLETRVAKIEKLLQK